MSENILKRRQCIPIIYTKGTHYEVGYDVGRNFSSVINEFIKLHKPLQDEFIPAYKTPKGRKIYENTLNCLKENFPQYLDELQGTADGAQVPFYNLFLLHLDNIILDNEENKIINPTSSGCSTICINEPGQEILGHTEDALSETLNHFYFVSAKIHTEKPQGKWQIKDEEFTSLCYAGHLPGYTMSYADKSGLIFSINTLSANKLYPGKTPRHFLARALLTAQNFHQAYEILRDSGCGAADGCSINITFLNENKEKRLFYNVEMAPPDDEKKLKESQLNVVKGNSGDCLIHCNSYLRIPIKDSNKFMIESSKERMKTFKKYGKPSNKENVMKMLSDETHKEYPVFHDKTCDYVKTLAVGIFDCVERTWSLYSDKPTNNEPLVVLHL